MCVYLKIIPYGFTAPPPSIEKVFYEHSLFLDIICSGHCLTFFFTDVFTNHHLHHGHKIDRDDGRYIVVLLDVY